MSQLNDRIFCFISNIVNQALNKTFENDSNL